MANIVDEIVIGQPKLCRLGQKPHQELVREFMQRCGQKLPVNPTTPDEWTRLQRAKLILEEALEACEALGVELTFNGPTQSPVTKDQIKFRPYKFGQSDDEPVYLPELVKELADIIVVTTGTALACGIDIDPIQEIVDYNNLTKFEEGGYLNEHGKWIKPPSYNKPDLKPELLDQGWNPEE